MMNRCLLCVIRRFSTIRKICISADLLKDMHDAEVSARQGESDYLFIIGGDDDVPMPCMPNYTQNNDKTFDTDLLYAYPYGVEMERKLRSQEIFKYDALFYIGRLPIADDGTFSDLQNYLQRVVENECSVEIDRALRCSADQC